MDSNILVTGGRGFIGSNLVNELRAGGCNVKELGGDILDKAHLLEAAKDVDTLFHCAGFISFDRRDFDTSYKVNVLGTKNVLDAALYNRVKKVIHLSSASVLGYAKKADKAIDENCNFCVSKKNSYTYTKKLAEDAIREYANKGLDISIANITTVYGRGDRKLNSGALIKSIYKNRINFAPPGGTSYVSINDLVGGLILLSEKGRKGERYIFCAENLTFFDLFNRIARCLGKKSIKLTLPKWSLAPALCAVGLKNIFLRDSGRKINILTNEIIKESYFYKYYSPKKAGDELGWWPRVLLEQAVGEAMEFYLKERLI